MKRKIEIKEVKDVIKQVVKKNGWTTEALSVEMTNRKGEKGITQSSVSQLLNGNPTLDKLVEIANIIGVSLSELVADESDQSRHEVICPHCGGKVEFSVQVEVCPKN